MSKTIVIFLIILGAGLVFTSGCSRQPDESTPLGSETRSKVKKVAIPPNPTIPGQMTIVYYSDYRPMSWLDEDEEMRGALIDVLDEALNRRMGIPVRHLGYPWARAQEMVRQGEADAFVSTPTDERRTYAEIGQESIVNDNTAIFVNELSPRFNEMSKIHILEDLRPFAMSNYSGNGWAKQRLEGMNITWVSTPQQALQMVASGRVDAYVDSSPITNDIIRRMSIKNIFELPVVLDTVNFYLCIGKKSPFSDILPEFDTTIKEMKNSGELQAILDDYLSAQ